MNKVVGFDISAHTGLAPKTTVHFRCQILNHPRKTYREQGGPTEKDWTTRDIKDEREVIELFDRIIAEDGEIIVHRIMEIVEFCMPKFQ